MLHTPHITAVRYWHSHFWQVRYRVMSEQAQPRVETPSGIPLAPVYGPQDRSGEPPPPGTYPFTRGNFASGYRGKTWTFRQYSGFGTAEESNRRYRYLLDQGGTGLSVALDLPTQCGYDSDDDEYGEEVGRVGVAVDTLADAEILFDGIPLEAISTSFTINGTAAILLAFYVAAAEKKGVPREKLTGTIQNDILKEYASRAPGSGRRNRHCGSSPTPSSSARPRCPSSTRSRWRARTSATQAPTRFRRWRSRSPTG